MIRLVPSDNTQGERAGGSTNDDLRSSSIGPPRVLSLPEGHRGRAT